MLANPKHCLAKVKPIHSLHAFNLGKLDPKPSPHPHHHPSDLFGLNMKILSRHECGYKVEHLQDNHVCVCIESRKVHEIEDFEDPKAGT